MVFSPFFRVLREPMTTIPYKLFVYEVTLIGDNFHKLSPKFGEHVKKPKEKRGFDFNFNLVMP